MQLITPSARPHRTALVAGAGLLLVGLSACSVKDENGPTPISEPAVGQVNAKPDDGGATGGFYFVDSHDAGQAGALFIEDLVLGRLVSIYDREPEPGNPENIRQVFQDFLIGEDLVTEPGKWTLDSNPVTGEVRLIVEDPTAVVSPAGLPNSVLTALIEETTVGLASVIDKSIALGTSPPFTLAPRNCSVMVKFSDLIDPSSIVLQDSVKVTVGSPPTSPQEVRLVLDPNHGGLNPLTGGFESTRLLVDFTVNSFEQLSSTSALQLNGLGLPPSLGVDQANVGLSFPTNANPTFGQFSFLRNLSGSALSQSDNGSTVNGTTFDVVRALRSGNSLDVNNGFLVDSEEPVLIGVQRVSVNQAALGDELGQFVVSFTFEASQCATDPIPGDVLSLNGGLYEVVEPGAVSAGVVTGLRVRVPGGTAIADIPDASLLVGNGSFQTPFREGVTDDVPAACFVRFVPEPETIPALNVPSNARVLLRFSEPVDPEGLSAFDSFTVGRVAAANTPNAFRDRVVGRVELSADLLEASFVPALDFSQNGANENYFMSLVSEPELGVSDLAGNPLEISLPEIPFTVRGDGQDPAVNAGWSTNFASLDEDGFEGFDIVGQFLYLSELETVVPRPIARFSQVADRQNPIIGAMTAVTAGLQTPLSDLGSKLHLMWRYADVGLSVSDTDPSFVNVDVEGVALAPSNGQVTPAFYPEFEMRLGHARPMPDELVDPMTGAVVFPNSGFLQTWTYDQNFLGDPNATVEVVHERQDGYSVSSLGLFTAPETETPMLAMPMNQNVPVSEFMTYTWRDTAILGRGGLAASGIGSSANGVPFSTEVANGLTEDCWGGVYGTIFLGAEYQGVRSIGLPLLMEFSCFPSNTVSLNSFDASFAVGTSNQPFYRAFSTGGFDANGNSIKKDPDNQQIPTGGFNGNVATGLPLGAATDPRDNTVYIGQLDLVVRISRVYTVMIDSLASASNTTPDYAEIVLEPDASAQPDGTSIQVAYRGHSNASGAMDPRFQDGELLSVYGDISYAPLLTPEADCAPDEKNPPGAVFDPSVPTWSDSIDSIDGLDWSQIRLTFVGDTASGLTPSLSGLGVVYRLP